MTISQCPIGRQEAVTNYVNLLLDGGRELNHKQFGDGCHPVQHESWELAVGYPTAGAGKPMCVAGCNRFLSF